MGGHEQEFVRDAFESNWIAPLGPHVAAFEREFCAAVGAANGVALSTGTAALHLAFQLLGVGPGDEVLVSTLTFAASVNPIVYLGARPVFIDSERISWNLDPARLEAALEARRRAGRPPKAVAAIHLYGQSADLDSICELCEHYGVPLVEDAAESLGASYRGRAPGTFGAAGIYSFNGNKVITTSGGGMLVSPDEDLVRHALKLATQAREPVPHYEHEEIGYNYRMSNVLAAIGRGQLRVLQDHVEARRANFALYQRLLGDLAGIEFMPEAPWGRHSRWLTTLTIDPDAFGTDREALRLALEAQNIEARPVWKPMHRQPVFTDYESVGGEVADDLFGRGLCLPSSSNLTSEQVERVADEVRRVAMRHQRPRRGRREMIDSGVPLAKAREVLE
jgi:pyridoxal phosphate-dependent aminotransferase EpsN